MNQKRKADLQRKLSMTSVPRPPNGLSDRIKADIPELLDTSRDRERLSRSTAFTMRVAASVILLVSSVYVVMHLMWRSAEKGQMAMNEPPATRMRRNAPAAVAPPPSAPVPQAEVTITFADNKQQAQAADEFQAAVRQQPKEETAKPALVARADAQKKLEKDEDLRRAESRDAVTTNEVLTREKAAETIAVTAAAPALVPPPPPPAAAPVAAPAVAEVESKTSAANAGAMDIVKSARAADLSYEAPRALFGISIDPAAFDRVKRTIEQGSKPAAGSVDVSALVNYFAGAGRPPRRDVRLDVEASRAPLASDNTALLRFTIDTPRQDVPFGGSVAPAATNADLEIWLNSQAVATHHLVGAEELTTQATLLKNVSVTGLVDLKLKPGVLPRTTIATFTLRYRNVEDGKWRTITQSVQASQVTRMWASATRRHRLATLGAVWSESLNSGAAKGDVAGTAEKLATEKPSDARARDLADVARMSSGG